MPLEVHMPGQVRIKQQYSGEDDQPDHGDKYIGERVFVVTPKQRTDEEQSENRGNGIALPAELAPINTSALGRSPTHFVAHLVHDHLPPVADVHADNLEHGVQADEGEKNEYRRSDRLIDR